MANSVSDRCLLIAGKCQPCRVVQSPADATDTSAPPRRREYHRRHVFAIGTPRNAASWPSAAALASRRPVLFGSAQTFKECSLLAAPGFGCHGAWNSRSEAVLRITNRGTVPLPWRDVGE